MFTPDETLKMKRRGVGCLGVTALMAIGIYGCLWLYQGISATVAPIPAVLLTAPLAVFVFVLVLYVGGQHDRHTAVLWTGAAAIFAVCVLGAMFGDTWFPTAAPTINFSWLQTFWNWLQTAWAAGWTP